MQRSLVAHAAFERAVELKGHELGKHGFAKVVQQPGDETIHRIDRAPALRQLLGNASGGQRMQQILLRIKPGSVGGGQHPHGGNGEREILDGIDAQMHHRMVHRGDPARQVVVGRVHNLEDLHGDDRVLVDHLHQIFRRTVHIAGELQDALHALGEGRHAVDRRG